MTRFHDSLQTGGMIGAMEGGTESGDREDPRDDKDQQGHHDLADAVFTMREAAEVARVSVSTIRRRREDLVAAGADITDQGWQVPMTALIGAGLIAGEGPRREETTPEAVPEEPSETKQDEQRGDDRSGRVEELLEALRDAERERDDWRRRAEIAEAVSEERRYSLEALRAANESERLALRMLTAGDSPRPTAPEQTAGEPEREQRPASEESPQREVHAGQEPRRRGFWDKMMGR